VVGGFYFFLILEKEAIAWGHALLVARAKHFFGAHISGEGSLFAASNAAAEIIGQLHVGIGEYATALANGFGSHIADFFTIIHAGVEAIENRKAFLSKD
jgi:hypothetical protein